MTRPSILSVQPAKLRRVAIALGKSTIGAGSETGLPTSSDLELGQFLEVALDEIGEPIEPAAALRSETERQLPCKAVWRP